MQSKALQKPIRESGIELLRILMMLQVIFLHVCSSTHGGFTGLAEGGDLGDGTLLFYRAMFYCSRCPVYVYIILTGYFSVTSNKTFSDVRPKLLKTYFPMLFYSIGIPFVGWAMGMWDLTSIQSIKAFFPFLCKTWYFMTLYLLVVALSPFLNKCLTNLKKKEYLWLLGILFFVFCIMTAISGIKPLSDVFSVDKVVSTQGGKGLYGFLFMYILGGFLRLHIPPFGGPKIRFLLAFFGLAAINIGLLYAYPPYFKVITHNQNLFSVLQCVCLVLFFREVKFRSRVINYIAGSCLGVYMLHEHPIFRKFIWDSIFPMTQEVGFYSQWYFPLKIAAICVIIFVGCALIDQIRIYFFKAIDYCIAKGKAAKA